MKRQYQPRLDNNVERPLPPEHWRLKKTITGVAHQSYLGVAKSAKTWYFEIPELSGIIISKAK